MKMNAKDKTKQNKTKTLWCEDRCYIHVGLYELTFVHVFQTVQTAGEQLF